jgi:hypothetical protein
MIENAINRKIVERGKKITHNTQVQDRSLSWLGTSHSIKYDSVKQDF